MALPSPLPIRRQRASIQSTVMRSKGLVHSMTLRRKVQEAAGRPTARYSLRLCRRCRREGKEEARSEEPSSGMDARVVMRAALICQVQPRWEAHLCSDSHRRVHLEQGLLPPPQAAKQLVRAVVLPAKAVWRACEQPSRALLPPSTSRLRPILIKKPCQCPRFPPMAAPARQLQVAQGPL